jgi:hypothetical protein
VHFFVWAELRRSLAAAATTLGLAVAVALMATTNAAAATQATLYVDPSGSSSSCTGTGAAACPTVQQAITAAEGAGFAGEDVTIDVTPGTYTENDTVTGGSEATLTIQPTPGSTGTVTLNGGAAGSVLSVDLPAPSMQLQLYSLTITNGLAGGDGGGGIDDVGDGTLTVWTSTVTDNTARGTDGSTGVSGTSVSGGGILNEGNGVISVDSSTVTQNNAVGGKGGDGQSASPGGSAGGAGVLGGDAYGGGIANIGSGEIGVGQSTISDNIARAGVGGGGGGGGNSFLGGAGGSGGDGGTGADAYGGALFSSDGSITVEASTVNGNQALGGAGGDGGAGGEGGAGTPGIDGGGSAGGPGQDGGVGGAGGNGQEGGGARGGAWAALGASSVDLQHATLNANAATAGNGGNGGAGGEGGAGGPGGNGTPVGVAGNGGDGGAAGNGQAGGPAYGGGLYSEVTAEVKNVTDAYNSATSGNGGNGGRGGNAGVVGSPGSGGTDGNGGHAGDGSDGGANAGGGVDGDGGAVQVLDSTISENAIPFGANGAPGLPGTGASSGGTGTAGSPGAGAGGGIYSLSGDVSVGASIVASNEVSECAGAVDDLGYNLSEEAPGSTCGLSTGSHDVTGVSNPVMGALQENGGPTQTMLPNSQSAIAIPNATTLAAVQVCPRTDQRGVPGPIAGQTDCTIGAIEDLPGQAPVLSSGSTSLVYTIGAAAQQGWPASLTFTGIPISAVTESGSLPSGVGFASAAGTGTFDQLGTFSGTPTQTGVFPVTLTADNGYPDLSTAVQLKVDQATSTSVALTHGTAQVGQALTFQATVTSELALKGGSVAFSDSLGAMSGCGAQPLSAQNPTSATATCTTQAYSKAGADQIKASFSGDTEDLPSSGSQAVTVAELPAAPIPTPAPTPTPKKATPHPTIRASLYSKGHKSSSGWWTTAVTIRFACKAGGGKLAGRCPAAVKLTKSVKDLSVRRTIRTTTGQRASVTVRGIHIDLTRPHVRIRGPLESGSYAFSAPKAHCHATDRYSGVKSCTLTERRVAAPGGYKILYGARAVAGSGTVGKAGKLSFVTTVNIVGGSEISADYWSVTPGHTYELQVLSKTRPTYLDAAPGAVRPTGPYDYFSQVGTVDGIPLWQTPIAITKGFALFKSWTVGIQTGTTVRRIKLLTHY